MFGRRRLLKNKVTSAAAILSLALAMGACLAVFQLVDALLLRPLPVASPDRLYSLSRQGYGGWEYPLFSQMRDAVRTQATLVAISYAERVDLTFGSDLEMEKAHVQYVSGSLFARFGIRDAMGRLFTGNDDREPGAKPAELGMLAIDACRADRSGYSFARAVDAHS